MKICLLCALTFLAINAGFGQAELVKDINTAPASSLSSGGILFKDKFYFIVGNALWQSNGTAVGTKLVDGLESIAVNGNLISTSDFIFFVGYDETHGAELWKSDGTSSIILTDISTGESSTNIQLLTECNGLIYFSNGKEFWVTDGTTESTIILEQFEMDILGECGCFGGKIFFTPTGSLENGVWVSDGTAPGTKFFLRRVGIIFLQRMVNFIF